ncbi:MAG: TIGR04190 family B12-binding domain/radical SAM domain protein [Anaerolineae bacterium]|nr:TIGR04190 family B12-binding domain/radical SAM domain protein [Anaerolineae bacterium]
MPPLDLVLLHAPSVYDFREHSILYGPVSDLVPSTPVFEMYPIGFTTIAEYLEQRGWRVRIVNLALRMLRDARFDAEALVRQLNPAAFGIDLHWLPHAHGALAVAELVKRHHPQTPVIFGGFSASYYHEELLRLPSVDYVVRGDSTEEPMHRLLECIKAGREPEGVPNVAWRSSGGTVKANPLSYIPPDLDHVALDYGFVVRSVATYRDLLSHVPFHNWLDYPITAALTVRGCSQGCVTCGGSAYAFRRAFGRARPAYRSPERLARDVRRIAQFIKGPVFILGDLRQPGEAYAQRFLDAVRGHTGPVIVELFGPASADYLRRVKRALPNFTLEVSLESHDPAVRRAFGKGYDNAAIEATLGHALDAGCRRLDVFFMIGLPEQTSDSVLQTVDYCGELLERFARGPEPRAYPFISPLAPFLDPASAAFEEPERHGYRLFYRSLEEHRRALVQPSWKYVLNYETRWMTRDEIVASTYEAGLRLNRLKARYGLVSARQAEATEARIKAAVALSAEIDRIVALPDRAERERRLSALKPAVDRANMSTVCDKRELELPVGLMKLNLPRAACYFLGGEVRRLFGRRGRA